MNGRKILRIAMAIAVATTISALTASTAEAICQNSGKDNYRRLNVTTRLGGHLLHRRRAIDPIHQ